MNLRSKGLVSGPFEDFVHSTKYNYNQVLFVDLMPYKIKNSVDLAVDAYFTGMDPCPQQMHLVACAVKQYVITKEGRKWTVSTVVP